MPTILVLLDDAHPDVGEVTDDDRPQARELGRRVAELALRLAAR